MVPDGRLLTMEDPSGGIRRYSYDGTGNTTNYQVGGEQRERKYNYLGQQTRVIKNEYGRVQGNTYYEYDNHGWLLEKERIGQGGGTLEKVNYLYNQMGSVETVNPQGGQQRTYTRDALERTTQVSTEDGKNFTYEYYGDGAIKRSSIPAAAFARTIPMTMRTA